MGAVVKDFSFEMGQDIAMIKAAGDCAYVLESDNFSSLLTAWKGGLSAMPTKPSAPVYHGTQAIGFTGSITLDAQSIATLKSATIKVSTGAQQVMDTFGSYISSGVEADTRTVSVSFVLDDDDGSAIADLKQKAWAFTPVDMTFVCGTVAGNIWTWTLKSVQMANAKFNDGQRRVRVDFADSTAHGSVLSGLDSLALSLT